MITYVGMATIFDAMTNKKMPVTRCPECGTWGTVPYRCPQCGCESVTQGEYLTRRASGVQPARIGGSEA